jgi:hypothetical protein
MKKSIPGLILGALVGSWIGFLTYIGLAMLVSDGEGTRSLGAALVIYGLVFGMAIEGLRQSDSPGNRLVGQWCVTMAITGGCVGFVVGTLGPFVFWPGLPHGPLMGIFLTGPSGIMAGVFIALFFGSPHQSKMPAPESAYSRLSEMPPFDRASGCGIPPAANFAVDRCNEGCPDAPTDFVNPPHAAAAAIGSGQL